MRTFVVIGLGRFGESVAKELYASGHEVLAIDENEGMVQRIADDVTHAVVADARDENVLRSLGVRNYDCAVVALGSNVSASVLITLALKEIGVRQVVCKANDRQHKKILEKIGADRVLIPEFEMGRKLATQLSMEKLRDFIELAADYGISEIDVPQNWVGRSIREVDIRKKYNINVIAVKNHQDKVAVSPGPDYVFGKEDLVVVIGRNDDMASTLL